MLFHSRMLHKADATESAISGDPRLSRLLGRHVVLAPPARQHPFWMFGEPFRGIVLATHQAGLKREILDWTLLGAGGRRALQAKCYDPRHFLAVGVVAALAAPPAQAEVNDYPTSARADYVIGCMAANGNTREALLKCSCAIDTIASIMPYSHYEEAETALSLQAGGGVGGRVGLFRDPPEIKAVIEELHRAQAEANLQCR